MSENKASYRETRWTLKELLPSTDKSVIDKAVADIEDAASRIESMRPLLTPDISREDFVKAVKALEDFARKASIPGAYAALWFSEDTQDQNALAFMGKIELLITNVRNRILFFDLWWKELDEEVAGRLLDASGDLRYYLEKLRLFRKYTLSEKEERVINIKDINGSNALSTLYDIMTNKFVFEMEVDGEKKSLNRDALMAYVRNPSADIREKAYREQFRVYGNEATVLSQIYVHRVRDWAGENMGLRGFGSPISVRNLANDIPDKVVETLLSVCSERAPVFHRYFKLKARLLNLQKLRRFDLYTPLGNKSERKIPYPEAVHMVLDSFERFSKDMYLRAKRVLDEGHADSEIRPNKRGGAFCYSVIPELAPWVLLNYTGEPRQVATLAHELGHAIHSLLAERHSVLTFHSALPLAETASVFSEMLLMDRMISDEKNSKSRAGLLVEVIDDAYATVMRQAFFVRFENDAHRMINEDCTIDNINSLYLDNLRLQFGDSVDVDEIFTREWISIPHIYHAPFYCYAYSFGQLLSLSLYQQYKEKGSSMVSSLLRLLSYGGAASPRHILSEAGIDMEDADFWRGGFRLIEGMIDELERSI